MVLEDPFFFFFTLNTLPRDGEPSNGSGFDSLLSSEYSEKAEPVKPYLSVDSFSYFSLLKI